MSSAKYFVIFVVFFLGGVVMDEFLREGDLVKVVVLGGAGVWLMRNVGWKVLVVGVAGILFGVLRFYASFFGMGDVGGVGEGVEFEGCIVAEVDVRTDMVKYTVWSDEYGRVLVNGNRYPVYEYGDCLRVWGELEIGGEIDGFSYDKYLSRYGVSYVIYRAGVERVISDGGGVYGVLYWVKGWFEGRIEKVFAEPHGSFMAGLLLGSRKGIPDNLMESFNRTGLTHIIAISGYNITIVIVVVSGMFGFLSRKWKVVACGVFIILFVLLVGASAAVVRAAIMGVISLMALFYGRQYYVFISLFAAGFLMNLWNPKILVYDVGFQLSFLATLGIVVFAEELGKKFERVSGLFGIREALVMTFAVQVLALPLIVLNFGRLSLISPLANVFVLPFIPFAMLFGFLGVLGGKIFGFFGYLILEFIIFVVNLFSKIEWASLRIEWFSWWMFALYYLWIFGRVKKAITSSI
ncbi:MAG: ComEC/Rec2 family competence protein [Candidatus Peregrinibacteria bacterium]